MIENAQAHEMIHVPGLRKLLLEAQAAQYDEFPRQAALKSERRRVESDYISAKAGHEAQNGSRDRSLSISGTECPPGYMPS